MTTLTCMQFSCSLPFNQVDLKMKTNEKKISSVHNLVRMTAIQPIQTTTHQKMSLTLMARRTLLTPREGHKGDHCGILDFAIFSCKCCKLSQNWRAKAWADEFDQEQFVPELACEGMGRQILCDTELMANSGSNEIALPCETFFHI